MVSAGYTGDVYQLLYGNRFRKMDFSTGEGGNEENRRQSKQTSRGKEDPSSERKKEKHCSLRTKVESIGEKKKKESKSE